MSKFAGFIVGALEIGIGIATGNPTLIIQGSLTIAAQAIVDLTAPKAPARQASEMTIALGEQPRCILFGETFTPGSLVDGFDYGGKYGTDWEVLIIRLADHKCEGLTGFFVDDTYVLYTGDGNYPQFDGHHFSLWFRPDTTADPLPSVVTDNGPGWTAADLGESGCDVIVAYLADKPDAKHPAWPGGRPKFGFVVKGKLCYDPRKDDTVSGGAGAHRWDTPSTWEWSDNAVVCWYNFERGVFANDDVSDPTMLLVGRGLTSDESPPENIFAGANLCEEATGDALGYDIEAAPHYGAGLGAFTRDFSRFMTLDAAGSGFYALWDTYSRTLLKTGDMPCSVGEFVFTPSGQAYIRSGAFEVRTLTIDSAGTVTAGPAAAVPNAIFGIYYAGGLGCLTALGAQTFAQTYDGTAVTAIDVGFSVLSYLTGPDGLPWALGISGSDIKVRQVGGGGTALTVANSAGGGATPVGLSNSDGNIILFQGNSFVVINVAGVIQFSGSLPSGIGHETIINHDGSDTIWAQIYEISLIDGSVIRSFTYSDWYLGAGSDMYDPVNNALFGQKPADSAHVNWLFLPSARYLVAGPVYSNQEHIDVEAMFEAATAGNITTTEGAILLEPGQAKSVVATITDDDLLVGAETSWNLGFLSESNNEWVNTVVANYIEPAQKWNSHNTPPLRDEADIIADGRPREAQLPLRLVRYADQAMRIAEINRRLGRLWGRVTITLGPRRCELEAGDWIAWQSDLYFGGGTKTFCIKSSAIDEKWQNTITMRETAASVYADDGVFAADQSKAAAPTLLPQIGSPASADWALTATTLVSAGTTVPALEIAGAMPADENAENITVEYWKSDGVTDPTANPDAIPWTMAGPYSPTTTKIDVTSIEGGGTYYVAVSYVVSGEAGDRLVLGPVTVANVDISGQVDDLAAPKLLPIVAVIGTSYTLLATDFNKHLRFTNASGCTVIVPRNVTAAYPVGGRTRLTDATGADVTLFPEDGTVTLNSRDGALLSGGHLAVFEVEKIDTNEWDVLGDVTT